MTRIEKNDVDFLDSKNKIVEVPRKKLGALSKTVLALGVLFAVFVASFGVGIITSGEHLAKKLGDVGLLGQLRNLMSSEDKKLAGEEDDRINILLLGMGGENHDGPYLSDTIILASYKPSTNKVAMLSIPRDLLVNIPGYGWWKINHANAFGEQDNPGLGGELAKETISGIFNLPIHYYVRIDFAGFEQLIDDLGGVTIDVENEINDYQYPVPGKEEASLNERYLHLHIEKGLQEMDGDLALKYVRSRHSGGVEGSDFARSARQQKLLMAAKDKALSFGTIANPYRVSRIMETMSKHLATDLEIWEILKLYNMTKDVSETDITRFVFDNSPDGLLYSTVTENGAFVLKPRSGNFTQMQYVAQNIFSQTNSPEDDQNAASDKKVLAEKKNTAPPAQAAAAVLPPAPPDLEVHNGTKINGLASRIKQSLVNEGYSVIRVANAPTQDYSKTVVYNLGDDAHDDEAKKIARFLDGSVADSVPAWAKERKGVGANSDILIILGQDQQQ